MPRPPRDTFPDGRPFPPNVLERRAKHEARKAERAAKRADEAARLDALERRIEALERRGGPNG